MLNEELKKTLVVLAWSISMASIILQALLYGRQPLSTFDLLFLFIVSTLAGLVLVDIKWIILGYAGSLFLSTLLMFVCLTLPVTLGKLLYAFHGEFVQLLTINMIFTALFPYSILACFFGVLFGGFLAERTRLS